jgi:hypothetical protein
MLVSAIGYRAIRKFGVIVASPLRGRMLRAQVVVLFYVLAGVWGGFEQTIALTIGFLFTVGAKRLAVVKACRRVCLRFSVVMAIIGMCHHLVLPAAAGSEFTPSDSVIPGTFLTVAAGVVLEGVLGLKQSAEQTAPCVVQHPDVEQSCTSVPRRPSVVKDEYGAYVHNGGSAPDMVHAAACSFPQGSTGILDFSKYGNNVAHLAALLQSDGTPLS